MNAKTAQARRREMGEVKRLKEGSEFLVLRPPLKRILGRKILDWSPYKGSYAEGGISEGGPAFFGLLLKATKRYPKEWLILLVGGGIRWLVVNSRWLASDFNKKAKYRRQRRYTKPLFSETRFWWDSASRVEGWDLFRPMVVGKAVTGFKTTKHESRIAVKGVTIELKADPKSRPRYPAGSLRTLDPGDDLRSAWILAVDGASICV